MGLFINDRFLHVTRDSMDNFVYLAIITLCCDFIPLTFMFFLVPTLEEANNIQKAIAYENKLPKSDESSESSCSLEDVEEKERLL